MRLLTASQSAMLRLLGALASSLIIGPWLAYAGPVHLEPRDTKFYSSEAPLIVNTSSGISMLLNRTEPKTLES
jgi:hypothetical protein